MQTSEVHHTEDYSVSWAAARCNTTDKAIGYALLSILAAAPQTNDLEGCLADQQIGNKTTTANNLQEIDVHVWFQIEHKSSESSQDACSLPDEEAKQNFRSGIVQIFQETD